jgi:large subunit ribosomal protein L6
MSRIGNKPIQVPDAVKVQLDGRRVAVEGPLGKLQWEHPAKVAVAHDAEAKVITVARHDHQRSSRALHGLTRALIQNMVTGVTEGYEKRLEIHGIGYLAALAGNVLQLRVGYANELQVPIPEGLNVTVPDQQHVVIRGIDKQKVGEFAAEVRALRKPEPYKGKGIRYYGEQIRRKQGKAMVK